MKILKLFLTIGLLGIILVPPTPPRGIIIRPLCYVPECIIW